MPILIALGVLAILFVVMLASIPFSLYFRFRQGTRRRPARGWVASVNFWSLVISTLLYFLSASILSFADPRATSMAAAGLAAGGVLGILGLAITKWEPSPQMLYYTPNRYLILVITVVVTARIGYGIWRGFSVWGRTDDHSWIVAAGAANALAFGAVVLGYYLVYWFGMKSRIRRHAEGVRRRPRR